MAKLDFRMGDRFLGHAGGRKGDRTKKLVFARARDGRGGIRTHEGLAPLAVFKSVEALSGPFPNTPEHVVNCLKLLAVSSSFLPVLATTGR